MWVLTQFFSKKITCTSSPDISEPISRVILGKHNLSHSLQLYIGLHAVARDSMLQQLFHCLSKDRDLRFFFQAHFTRQEGRESVFNTEVSAKLDKMNDSQNKTNEAQEKVLDLLSAILIEEASPPQFSALTYIEISYRSNTVKW